MNTTGDLYWFGVTAVLRCRVCNRESVERMVLTQLRKDRSSIGEKALFRVRRCAKCDAPVVDANDVVLYVLPGTPSHLKNKGFPVPENALVAKAG